MRGTKITRLANAPSRPGTRLAASTSDEGSVRDAVTVSPASTYRRPEAGSSGGFRALGRRRRGQAGVTVAEFTFVAPIGFLLLLGIIVVGILVTNLVQLTNGAREGARLAAICGSNTSAAMPDGSGRACTAVNIASYITDHLVAVPAGSVSPQIYVCAPDDLAAGT